MLDNKLLEKYTKSEIFTDSLKIPRDQNIELVPLAQGEYNVNYSFSHPENGKKLLLRINTGSQLHLDDQIEYEFSALQDLYPSGRTPKAYFCDNSRSLIPHGVMVMEWLPGRPLIYETDMADAAAILADIHSTPVPADCKLIRPGHPSASIYEECLQMVEHYLTWDEARPSTCRLLEELVKEIGRLPLKTSSQAAPCMVNTELNSGNFLINPGAVSYLIDWEKPLLSEPAQDLGHFLVPTTTLWKTETILSPEDIADFTLKYIKAVNGRIDISDLTERLPLFFTVTCLRGTTWSAMAMKEYSNPGRAIANADTFKKITQFLEDDFLENILKNYVKNNFLSGIKI